MIFDVAIVGSGPAGASCAAFCARSGLRVVVLERETFPREKVCGDCLNPSCWPVLDRLGVSEDIRALPQGRLDEVEFIAIDGRSVRVPLPQNRAAEIAVKRSALDQLLMSRAHFLGAEVRPGATVTALTREANEWRLRANDTEVRARFVIAADGRNSTVARLAGLLPAIAKERIALQAHVPLPRAFGHRVVLQFLPEGYSGQAPVNERELNLCLVGRAATLPRLRAWATAQFDLPPEQTWRTITPLRRRAISPAQRGLFLVGDAARVVEPFTGEGIFYALRSGELAAEAIAASTRGNDSEKIYARAHAEMYRGRLWINRLARAAVISPRMGSAFLELARFQPALLRLLTRKIAASPSSLS